jgi:hypothetical protein
MTDHQVLVTLEHETLKEASQFFDTVVTPLIRAGVMGIPPQLRQAWWDGFLASVVGAMGATIGEKATVESCTDLFTRAQDFAADLRKQKG